jgi:membrane associated rhomboid family serine protease
MRSASVGYQCPECVTEGRKSAVTARTVFGGGLSGQRGTVTLTLIWINVLVWVATVAEAVLSGKVPVNQLGRVVITGQVTDVTEWGAAIPAYICGSGQACGIAGGEFYRLLTADFLHFGIIHLGFNMYALWIIGRQCEQLLGRWRFLALYLFSGIGGSVAVYQFADPGQVSAGASASIFGLLGAMFFFLRRLRADPRGLVVLIVINFGLTFVVANISVWGHVGGFVVGAVVGAILTYLPSGRGRSSLQIIALCGVGLALAILVALRTASYGVLF